MKKQLKKLVLHRETLRRLSSSELVRVNGGDVTCNALDSGCFSCIGQPTATCPPANP
jgi:hypothetical protein